MVAEEGFEPSITDPESVVLPLHYSAKIPRQAVLPCPREAYHKKAPIKKSSKSGDFRVSFFHRPAGKSVTAQNRRFSTCQNLRRLLKCHSGLSHGGARNRPFRCKRPRKGTPPGENNFGGGCEIRATENRTFPLRFPERDRVSGFRSQLH